MMRKPAILALADGTLFEGNSVGAAGVCTGELVFNTSMTGYQEMMTDPSYARQIILLTTAHVGNTGFNLEDMESSRIWASGLVVRDCPTTYSNYRASISFSDWLIKHGIVAIAGIDTRQLTLHLREKGAMNACIITDSSKVEEAKQQAVQCISLDGLDLAKVVSRQTIERWHEGRGSWAPHSNALQYHIVAYDFGVKHNILKILFDMGCHITLVPAQTTAAEVMALNPDGIFLSNGPGDPKACDYAVEAIKEFLKLEIPIFGICLGFQLLGLACGAKTVKMKFGHHGANHPVQELMGKKRVFITSQNHGFTIEEIDLPNTLEITHRSLFDQSLQGIRHKTKPAIAFQGHPEANPGPHDMECIFSQFIEFMAQKAK